MQIEDRAAICFDDGAPGVAATVVFEPMPGLATGPLHAARKRRGDLVRTFGLTSAWAGQRGR